MRKFTTALAAAAIAAGMLTMPAAATAAPALPAAVATVKAHKPYSIERVKVELKKPAVQKVIRKEARSMRKEARKYGTSFAFERDVRVCELTYRTLHKPEHPRYWDDPTAHALSTCINLTISSHNMYE